MKKVSWIALLMIGLIAFTAVAGQITLRYWMWDPSIKAKVQTAINKFESLHPNIKVELTTIEPRDYWTKIRIMASTHKLPDVFNMSSGYIEEWSAKGLLLDIQKYVNTDLNMSDYFESLFNMAKYPKNTGDIYALPFAWVTPVLFFNKTAFDKAGLSYPNENWGWCDFLNAAEKLTIRENGKVKQWGFWLYGRYANIEPWIYRNGGHLLSADKKRFAPDKNAIETMEFLTKLVTTYKVAPKKKDMTGVRSQDVFPLGMAAMWVDGSWNIENNRSLVGNKFKWGIAPVPVGPNGSKNVIYAWPDMVAISSYTAHPKEAWELAKFLSGPGLTLDMYMAGKIPSYRPLAESEAFLEKGKQPAEKGILLQLGKGEMINSFTKGWSEWRGYGAAEGLGLNGALDAVMNGDMTFQEAMQKVMSYANKVLSRYYK